MISALTDAESDHDKLFALRRELQKLSLLDLAIRYEAKTDLSAYDGTRLGHEPPTSEEIDAMCQVPAD
ncbi:hypothetical protein COU14_02255 [Candidatus Kaiserbacteria bacterium CG10_big_fil_rev_8_21_14_0_10_44_10]|uniref:Uncharacterized protein n=1 Tax=Candidatus Kaiserbacteria bacterium CG10_big_fil_rev_8_21_14_0_10_44_10 TaxID=1974606 RepID=A0A2H0UHD1_9BACT|nr:MAG: hypothetical protein COU14_02255 [Candidatus Kaiserbacteria bacterium CG10_big_fil_rev_8_21_14_0_10_44_10]